MNKILGIAVVNLFILHIFSCYSNEEGCLDRYASNYSVSADNPCDACCTYPIVKMQFSERKIGENNMVLNDTITVDSMSFFKVTKLKYYLSNLKIYSADAVISNLDSIEIIDNELIKIENNFAYIDGLRSGADFYHTKFDGVIDSISFWVGLDPVISVEQTTKLKSGDVLYPPSGNIVNGNYCNLSIDVVVGTTIADTLRFNLCDYKIKSTLTFINKPSISEGVNINISLKQNFESVFKDIDFYTVDSIQLIHAIEENFVNIFELLE